jgi:PAS domain S-box-containing protein
VQKPQPKIYKAGQLHDENEADELLKSVLDNTSSSIILLKSIRDERGAITDFEYVFANKPALQSVRRESLVGKRYVVEDPFVVDNGLFKRYTEVISTGKDWNGELYIGGGFNVWSHVYVKKWKDGCLVTYHDITERKRAELELLNSRNIEEKLRKNEIRHEYLLKFAEAIKFVSDPIAIQQIAAWTLGEQLQANRVYYAEVNLDKRHFTVLRDYCRISDQQSISGIHEFDTFPNIVGHISGGHAFVERNVRLSNLLTDIEKKACLNFNIESFVTLPLIKNNRLTAIFVITASEPRKWDVSELELIEETADRTWSSVEQAKAEEALRNSEKKYHALFNSMEEGFCVCELIRDQKNKPVSWSFLEMNPALEKITGIKLDEIKDRLKTEIVNDSYDEFLSAFIDVVEKGKARRIEKHIASLDCWLGFTAYHFEGNLFALIIDDVTQRKRQEINVEFLAEISKDLVLINGFEEMMNRLGPKVARFFNLTRCFFTQVSDAKGQSTVSYEWHTDELPDVRGEYIVKEFLNPDYDLPSHVGEIMVVSDITKDIRINAKTWAALDIHSFVNVPLSRDGKWRFTTTMSDSKPRKWREDEILLIGELTDRVWSRLERVRVEMTLRDREERYRTLFTSINEGFILCEIIPGADGHVTDCNILEANPASHRIIGSESNIIGRKVSEAFLFFDSKWLAACERAAIDREVFSVIHLSKVSDYSRWLEIHFSPAGKPNEARFTIVYTDITDRIQAEQDLRGAEEKYRGELELKVEQRTTELNESREMLQSAFHASLVGITMLRAIRDEKNKIVDFECVFANTVSIRQSGGHNVVGKKMSEFSGGNSPVFERYVKAIELNEPQDFDFSSAAFGLDFRILAVKAGDGILINSEDITEKKKAQEKIKEQSTLIEEQYHFINEVVSTLPDMLSVMELETGRLLYGNRQPFGQSGFSLDELQSMSQDEKIELVHPDDRWKLIEFFGSIRLAPDDEIQSVEYRARRMGGQTEWFRARGKVFKRDAEGNAIQCVNVIQNIDRLKKSEYNLNMTIEQLKSSETHLKEAEKIGLMGSWEKNPSSNELIWSDELYRIFGFKPQSATITTDMYLNSTVHSEDRVKVAANLNDLYEKHIARPCEYRIIADKTEKILLSQPVIERNEAGDIIKFRGVVRDITSEKIAEKKLINLKLSQQKETLRAIMLAQEQERDRIGEALHNGVSQTLYAIQIRLANMEIADKAIREKLVELSSIVKDAIDETRLISFELVPAVLKDFGLEVALKTLLHRLSGVNIKFNLSIIGLKDRLAEDIEFSVYRIVQELLNNVMKHSKAKEAWIEIVSAKKGTSIIVADNGHGFNEKESVSMSKGIGLNNVRNRIKLMDGTFKITTSEKGTTVKIKFPV